MPKVKHHKKLLFYDKNNELFAELPLSHYQFASFIEDFDTVSHFLTSGQFTDVCRIDLYSAGRVLFSVVDLRRVVNQKNYTINFNPY